MSKPDNHCIPTHLWDAYLCIRTQWERSKPETIRYLTKRKPWLGQATVGYILSMPEEWRQRFWMAAFGHIDHIEANFP